MAHEAICRVWYGKRWGMPQSYREIGNFYGAVNLATLVMADRIEVIRRPQIPALAMKPRTIPREQ